MKKDNLNIISIIYAIFMVLFFMLAYLFIIVSIDTKTKIFVNYQETSTTNYRLTLLPNDLYEFTNISSNKSYLSSVIDDVIISFNYQNLFSEIVSGYYKYNVTANLLIYDKSINNPLVNKEYSLLEDKYIVLNQGNVTNFMLNDNFIIDYNKYLNTYQEITNKYNLSVLGNLRVNINFYEYLGFSSLTTDQEYKSTITINIPISDTTFKAKITDLSNTSNFYEYSKKEDVNYYTLIIGLIFLSSAISFLVLVIHTIKELYSHHLEYYHSLKTILNKYDSIIITTNKFYNFKQYNLIYVNSFKELLEVYEKYHILIIHREITKHKLSIFILIQGDNAWIYRLRNK